MARLLIVSFVEWAGAFQRPQHMAIGLARRGHDVTYATPLYLHRRRRQFSSGLELPPSLKIVEASQLPGASRSAFVASLNQKKMTRAIASRGGRYDAVIFNDPRWGRVAADLPAGARIFDCMDDLSAASPSPECARNWEQSALQVADRVWTGTASLADRLAGRHAHVRFIPGGVDFDHFANPDKEDVERAQSDLPAGEGPLAGYFGVLNERFDMRLVQALLDVPHWRVLLIGPATSRAPGVPPDPRLRHIGPRPYARLPAYLAHFNVGIIPYDTAGPHRFLYPVKALEYLAGNKPVLATPLPDVVRFLKEFVILGADPAAWNTAAQLIAADAGEVLKKTEAGRQYARGRSWEAMVAEIEQEIAASGLPTAPTG